MTTLPEWHKATYGSRPATFVVRRNGTCAWCGGEMVPGDDGCFLKEDAWDIGAPAHMDCLRLLFQMNRGATP